MTQTRTVHQVKKSTSELIKLFRAEALAALAADPATSQGDIEALTNVSVSWRGAIDGGIIITLDPVWPEA